MMVTVKWTGVESAERNHEAIALHLDDHSLILGGVFISNILPKSAYLDLSLRHGEVVV